MQGLRVAMIGFILLASASVVVVGRGQSRQNPTPVIGAPPVSGANIPGMGSRPDPMGNDPLNGRMEEQQIKSRNNERQKRLVSDTDRLLTLSKELKEQVEAPGKVPGAGDVGKKAEEIEKLAKSVKDHMKG
jgi:hypothetical protein